MSPSFQRRLELLPGILRRLRRRSGGRTLRSAAEKIERRTGVKLDPSRISRWERGESKPSLESLMAFLDGLGFSFMTLHWELGKAAREVAAASAAGDPAAEVGTADVREGAGTDPLTELAGRVIWLEEQVEELQELEDRIEELENEVL